MSVSRADPLPPTSTRCATSPTASRCDAAAARVLERHPRIDLLVNNAGVAARGNFLDADPERIEQVMRTNYLGSVWTTLAFLPGLAAGSHVVNVVSVAGTVAVGPYSASKHAQLAFSRSLARRAGTARGLGAHGEPGLRRDGRVPAARAVRQARVAPRHPARRSWSNGCSRRSTTTGARSRCPAGTGPPRGYRRWRRVPSHAYGRSSTNQPSVAAYPGGASRATRSRSAPTQPARSRYASRSRGSRSTSTRTTFSSSCANSSRSSCSGSTRDVDASRRALELVQRPRLLLVHRRELVDDEDDPASGFVTR